MTDDPFCEKCGSYKGKDQCYACAPMKECANCGDLVAFGECELCNPETSTVRVEKLY